MKVLVVGSGGREHAIIWKVAQSSKVEKIYAAPGNGGIAQLAECVDIKADDIDSLVAFALKNKIDLTIVGPEVALVLGIVDEFNKRNLRIFGPSKLAAQLEGSKVFAKEAMKKFGVPTANFEVFTNAAKARDYLSLRVSYPVVIKADGLAAGKGVIIAKTKKEALDAIKLIMEDKAFGTSGDRIIIEDCLVGEEASIIVISDGKNALSLASSQDHKAAYDGDKGPNTGGMGAYSPAPVVTEEMNKVCMEKIIQPMIDGMAHEGNKFIGVLYAGIMVTDSGPMVLEFNVRLGDPETQAILPRLNTDLLDLIEAALEERLDKVFTEWNKKTCVCVVAASGGYPGSYEKEKVISGLKEAGTLEDVVVFHAGTKLAAADKQKETVVTSGGRVLGVTALGEDVASAIKKSYEAIGRVSFDNMYYRGDIGAKAIKRGITV